MNATERAALLERKHLLSARAELERLQLSAALHDVRALIVPQVPDTGRRRSRVGMVGAAIVGIGVPLFGRSGLSRLLQLGSLAMTALRVARNWR